ncbi:MAG: glycosyl hydrolase family protein [Verrucomicrobia bacterium]|nr:MAG: glycosyl hydrolase family protein [Verrucomicrobiota bacterium]
MHTHAPMQALRRWLVGLLFTAGTTFAAAPGWNLTLDENFDGKELNPKIWSVETGQRRDAMNATDAVDVKDGKLVITTFTDEKGVTHCGFVTTRKKFWVTQGKAVARCRFHVEPGTQVAFWAQSPTYGKSGDPAKAAQDGVEMDIMETTGLMKGAYQYALHWGSYTPVTHKTSNHKFTDLVGAEWHDYGVEWDDTGYRFTRDGKVVATDEKCPGSKAPEFLLLTSESTIKSWNGERPKAGYGSKEKSTNTFEIDWVKVWERMPAP